MRTIGIDPDLKKSGVCGINEKGEILYLQSLCIVELIDLIQSNPGANFAIEDILKNKATYSRGRHSASVNMNIAQKVGMVKGAASIIIELIEHYTGKPPMLVPAGVGKQLKTDAKLFKKITGYEGQTNEDKRDAYCIALWAQNQL